jgi:hypothetical protein
MRAPIILLCFARPDYLRQVVESLAANETAGREIHLFQDGAVNAYSGIRYAEDETIAACVKLFTDFFPRARVHLSKENIGICESFLRAEKFAFEELGAEVAYFFEDDLVLSPHYLAVMDLLWEGVKDCERIAYFAAYGDHQASPRDQEAGRHRVVPMDHMWAFGLRATHWKEMSRFLKPYYDLVIGRDYRQRNHEAIRNWYHSLGHAPGGTSQDFAKALGTNLLDRWGARTHACWGRYVGETGVHCTPEFFERCGFGRTIMMDRPLDRIEIPDLAVIEKEIAEERARYRKTAEQYCRPATAEDVRMAYVLLLGREPESDAVVDCRIGMPLHQLRDMFLRSSEFRNLMAPFHLGRAAHGSESGRHPGESGDQG